MQNAIGVDEIDTCTFAIASEYVFVQQREMISCKEDEVFYEGSVYRHT